MPSTNVFLDTEVFIRASFNYTSPRFTTLSELARSDQIRVFLTDITVREITANIHRAVAKAINIRIEPILRNISTPEIQALIRPLDAASISGELIAQFERFIEDAKVTVLPVEGEHLKPVLDLYFDQLPPFGAGTKSKEFPDAFAIESIKSWCMEQEQRMAVVSSDSGMQAACADSESLDHFDDLAKYLDALASRNEALASSLRLVIPKHDQRIIDLARQAFANLGFYLMDVDGDVEDVQLLQVEFCDDAELISVGDGFAIAEIPCFLTFKANVVYSVPGTGSYDSEDGVLLFPEIKEEELLRRTKQKLVVEVSFEELDLSTIEIEGVFFNRDRDVEITVDQEWPYK